MTQAHSLPRWWMLALPALLVAGLWLGMRGTPVPSMPASVDIAALPSGAGALHTGQVATRPQAMPTQAGRAALPMPVSGDFEQATDLFVFAQSLALRIDAGDADALWLMARINAYCAPYATSPAAYARDTATLAAGGDAASATMRLARNRVAARCARFAPIDGLSAQAALELLQRAAGSGQLAAEAELLALGQPLSRQEGYARDLVERVSHTRDPDAFAALAPAMGLQASGDAARWGVVSGDLLAELAWQVAACRLGLDCSSDGRLMTSYCVNGGICSRDASQDFPAFVFDAGVPRQGTERLDTLVNQLLDASGEGK